MPRTLATANPREPAWMSLGELARELEGRTRSSREIVTAYLDRIAALDGRLHAFIDVYRDDALAAAAQADSERAAGRVCGPLHGLPIAIKDLVHIRGRMTTAGSRARPYGIANESATAWERLSAAGMIALGKTHLVEFAFGGWGRNAPMGAPWNPWDTRTHRVAGGSSSGSAVAVAAGLAPAAVGSDTGGSIRIPSGLCGLTGLKPTYGLVSLAGVFPLALTLDSVGPLARNAEDVALLTAAMAGADPRDPATLTAPAVDFAAAISGAPDIRGKRITALAVEQFPWPAMPDVLRVRNDAIAVLRSLGASVEESRVPVDFEDVMVKSGRIIAFEAYARHAAYIEDATLPFDPWVRKRMLAGKVISAADHADLLSAHERAAAAFADWMRGRDALLTPTLPITATPVSEVDEATTPLAAFTRAGNYLRACALSLPAGFSADRLPIGVQLMGAPFADATLVLLGRAFQTATDWHRQAPDLSAWQN
jgi:aspartyl-tRNA(Asn)/glutamyl-tRNA(Gln) amidotransferase subunit A